MRPRGALSGLLVYPRGHNHQRRRETCLPAGRPELDEAMGLAQITWGGIGERVIASAIVGVIMVLAAVPVIRWQMRSMSDALARLTDTVDGHETKLAALTQQRTECELRASRHYATREEFAQVLVETAGSHRETMARLDGMGTSVRESVGKVHARLDDVSERLARIEGREPQQPRVQT